MEEMVEHQVRCMFLLEQKSSAKPLNVASTPNTPSAAAGGGTSAHASLSRTASTSQASAKQTTPEVKQKSPFNRTDRRRFSFFHRRSNKDV